MNETDVKVNNKSKLKISPASHETGSHELELYRPRAGTIPQNIRIRATGKD